MKKSISLTIFFIALNIIAYGNTNDPSSKIFLVKCSDDITQFCLYGYPINNGLKRESSENYKNYLYLDYTDMDFKNPILSALLNNKEILKIKSRAAHINVLLERKRSQYQLYKVSIFGQLTSPVNNEINHHKTQTPRMEGLGIRLRF
ncbi:hypothetical protein D1818_12485 [Aquimarina sp. BL5]|uniref:hypothetical protein n=1 Tax=Aquimarina sp. BL5 TaxID=1714860 RepID=UPI000E510CFC|nr:hypothetical protein [Aquimarina sp. BL5]AXT51613.1 hypothetical protein D1818_12485 [Aquimarina sp. BL5]RKN08511.1 hypothetical protein D7036_05435 [Aquimarina sp. BL5]